MADRAYIITLDALDPTLDLAAVKRTIKQSERVHGWWNHLPGVFLVTSDLDADGLSEVLRPYLGSSRFLVVEVNLAESEGALPERGWDWIMRRSGQTIAA